MSRTRPKAPMPDCILGRRNMKAPMMMTIGRTIVRIDDQMDVWGTRES